MGLLAVILLGLFAWPARGLHLASKDLAELIADAAAGASEVQSVR